MKALWFSAVFFFKTVLPSQNVFNLICSKKFSSMPKSLHWNSSPSSRLYWLSANPFSYFLAVFCSCLFHASFLSFIWHSFMFLFFSQMSMVHHIINLCEPSCVCPSTSHSHFFCSRIPFWCIGYSFVLPSSTSTINSTALPPPPYLCSVVKKISTVIQEEK